MSLWLERFGTLTLPLVEAEQEIGSGGVRTRYMDLPTGGAFDVYGDERAPRGAYSLRASAEIMGTTQAETLAQWHAIWAMNRKRDRLYTRLDDGSLHWAYARLRVEPVTRQPENVLFVPVDMQFDVVSPVWYGQQHGPAWVLDAGEDLDAGKTLDESVGDVFTLTSGTLNLLTVTNAGNADTSAIILNVTAPGGGSVTALNIDVVPVDISRSSSLDFAGTIAATKTLIIDARTQSVYNDTAPAYADLSFSVAHSVSEWIVFGPGANSVQVEYTGTTGATLTVQFDDAWEV